VFKAAGTFSFTITKVGCCRSPGSRAPGLGKPSFFVLDVTSFSVSKTICPSCFTTTNVGYFFDKTSYNKSAVKITDHSSTVKTASKKKAIL
jgi:hypothetical protein